MSSFGFNSDLIFSISLVAGSLVLALVLELIGDFVFKSGKNKNATLHYRGAYNLKGPLVIFFIISGLLWSVSLLEFVVGDFVFPWSTVVSRGLPWSLDVDLKTAVWGLRSGIIGI